MSVPSNVVTFPTATVSADALLDCSRYIGYLAVYRVCMGVASFFLVMMLMMLCVFSSKDPRSYIQNGYIPPPPPFFLSMIHTYYNSPQLSMLFMYVSPFFSVCVCCLSYLFRFWCIKWVIVIGVVVAYFFIPDGTNLAFSRSQSSSYSHCVSV